MKNNGLFFFNFQNTNKIFNIPVFILFSPQLHANGKYYSPTQVPMHTRTTVNQYTVHTENPRLHDEYLQSVNASEYPALADRLTVTNEHYTGLVSMGSYTACSDWPGPAITSPDQ